MWVTVQTIFLQGLQPAGASLMSYTVKRSTLDDIYGQSFFAVRQYGTFKVFMQRSEPLCTLQIAVDF